MFLISTTRSFHRMLLPLPQSSVLIPISSCLFRNLSFIPIRQLFPQNSQNQLKKFRNNTSSNIFILHLLNVLERRSLFYQEKSTKTTTKEGLIWRNSCLRAHPSALFARRRKVLSRYYLWLLKIINLLLFITDFSSCICALKPTTKQKYCKQYEDLADLVDA